MVDQKSLEIEMSDSIESARVWNSIKKSTRFSWPLPIFRTVFVATHAGVRSVFYVTKIPGREYPVASNNCGEIVVALTPFDFRNENEGWINHAANCSLLNTTCFSIFSGSRSFAGGLMFRICITDQTSRTTLELSSCNTKDGWFMDQSARIAIHNDYTVRYRDIPLEVALGLRLFCYKHFIGHI